MKHISTLVLIIVAVVILVISIKMDNMRNKYWDEQFKVCGRAGFYLQDNECVPVGYLK